MKSPKGFTQAGTDSVANTKLIVAYYYPIKLPPPSGLLSHDIMILYAFQTKICFMGPFHI